MDLPRALKPWQRPLSLFPDDLAIALGGIVNTLSLLVGPLRSPDAAGSGEPDGIDGIGRRGKLERLLATEWALAEEEPLEFLRRYAGGELSFLELAYQRPSTARRCVALFDVGPDQRGGPRVVHLAALILLAQRASDAGASFSWGALQADPSELLSDVNEESVRSLLGASSPRRPTKADVERATKALSDASPEVWLIGGDRLEPLCEALPGSRIEIEESLDPDAPSDLHVRVFVERGAPQTTPPGGARQRDARLTLPEPRDAVRLLRDPFGVSRAAPSTSEARLERGAGIVFNSSFQQIFVRGARGELFTIPIPNSPNQWPAPKVRAFHPPPGQELIGVSPRRDGRSLVALTSDGATFFLHTLSKRGCTSARCDELRIDNQSEEPTLVTGRAPTPAATPKEALGSVFLVNRRPLYFYDGVSRLYQLAQGAARVCQSRVVAAYQESELLFWAHADGAPAIVNASADSSHATKLDLNLLGAVFGPDGAVALRTPGREGADQWTLRGPGGRELFSCYVDNSEEVIGVLHGSAPGLLVLDAQRTHIRSVREGTEEAWISASAPITSAAASSGGALVAFLIEAEELCVYSRADKALVLRLLMGRE